MGASSLCPELVDDLGEVFGEESGGLGGINAELGGEAHDLFTTKDMLDLLRGDGLVLAHPDPGGEDIAKAALAEFPHQALEAAVVTEEAADGALHGVGGFAFGSRFASDGTDDGIKKRHGCFMFDYSAIARSGRFLQNAA